MDLRQTAAKMREIIPVKYCGAVIVAAGSATRMGGIDKVMAPLGGEPMVAKTIRAFQESPVISEIVVVTRQDLIPRMEELCREFPKVIQVVPGGADRAASVEAGIGALSKKVKLIAIQDGARPLVSQPLIDRTVRAAHSFGAAVPGIPVKDTIKSENKGFVGETIPRETLRAIQTPQVFDEALIRGALKKANRENLPITDDSSAVELLKMSVKMVEGEEKNIKITTPLDLEIARVFMEAEV